MRPPCLNCQIRHLGCHDKCSQYQEFKRNFKSRDEEEAEYFNYVRGAIQRMKGRRF